MEAGGCPPSHRRFPFTPSGPGSCNQREPRGRAQGRSGLSHFPIGPRPQEAVGSLYSPAMHLQGGSVPLRALPLPV